MSEHINAEVAHIYGLDENEREYIDNKLWGY